MDEKQKLLIEVMLLAIKLQKETEYCVFVNYSGHVDSMTISIRKSKKDYNTDIAESDFYVDGKLSSIERIKRTKEKLLEFIKEKQVDTSQLNYKIEEIYHYTF